MHRQNADSAELNLLAQATALHQSGNLLEAVRGYSSILEQNPNQFHALHQLGVACQQLGKPQDARDLLLKARQVGSQVDLSELHCNLAAVLHSLGQFEQALDACRAASESGVKTFQAGLHESNALRGLGRHDESLAVLSQLAANYPLQASVWNGLAVAQQEAGQHQEAIQSYQHALQIDASNSTALFNLTQLMNDRNLPLEDTWLEQLIECVHRATNLPDRANLLFALATALDVRKDYESAFEFYEHANNSKLELLEIKQRKFHPAEFTNSVHRQLECFSHDRIGQLREQANPSDEPVFIVGMPRSGTTLVEQILASHPHVFGAGEHDTLEALVEEFAGNHRWESMPPSLYRHIGNAYLQRMRAIAAAEHDTCIRIINKLPGNWFYLGLIASIFPHARIIICRRDIRDTLVSCFCHNFQADRVAAVTSSFANLAIYAEQCQIALNHWQTVIPRQQWCEVPYETLTADPDKTIRQLADFIKVPWHDQMLSPEKSRRVVRTASVNQVRQPINRRGVGKWQRFQQQLIQHAPQIDWTRAAWNHSSVNAAVIPMATTPNSAATESTFRRCD